MIGLEIRIDIKYNRHLLGIKSQINYMIRFKMMGTKRVLSAEKKRA